MWNANPITLRKQKVFIRELTIGEAMQIAKIPQAMNEARLSSFIGYVCDDNELAQSLTVQERYYILLSYLSLAQNDYVLNLDNDAFFLKNTQADDSVTIDGLTISQLTGEMAMMLEQKCENIYEWLSGQMACQLSGDIGAYLGVDDWVWERITGELDETIGRRFERLESLSQSDFEKLTEVYFAGCDKLAHCVKLSMDNEGLTLMAEGGDTEQVARFCPHVCFGPIAERLSQYLAQ